jgi:hypothetical protein
MIKFAILFLAVLLLSTCAQAQGEANTNLSNGPFFDAEPSIAVNPIDQKNLVAAWMGVTLLKVTIHTRTSFDGGTTWSAVQTMPHFANSYTSADVSVAFNRKGEAFLCYVDYKLNTTDSALVVVARSKNGGSSWEKPVVVRDARNTTDVSVDRPWVAIDNSGGTLDGLIYVTAKPYSSNTNPNHTHLNTSSDDGLTWSADIRVDDSTFAPANSGSMGVLANGPNSTLYIAYGSYAPRINLFYRLICATSTDGGKTFTKHEIAPMTVAADSDFQFGYTISANPMKPGHAVAAWIDTKNGDPDVYCSTTSDAGATWSTPLRVNDDTVKNGAGQDMVWCAYSPDGRLAIAWRDRRGLGTGSHTKYALYGAISKDDGLHFDPNVMLSAAPSDFISLTKGNDFIGVAVDNNALHTVWGNYSANWEVYYDRHELPNLSVTIAHTNLNSNLRLSPIFPNPASAQSTLHFSLDRSMDLSMRILSVQGALIRETAPSHYEAGEHLWNIEASSLAPGTYFLEIISPTFSERTRFVLTK